MATIAPAALVTGAPRIQLPFGLFSVLNLREEGEGRWQNGAVWDPDRCDSVKGIGANDCDVESIVGLPKELTRDDGAMGEATPFTVYGWFNCSPVGKPVSAAQADANAHLTSREQARVEQALWTGDLGNTPNFAGANGYPAATSLGSFKLAGALAAVEQALAETYGSVGVIHTSRANVVLLQSYLESRGGVMYTILGTPVVAGAGYGDEKIVGTPALFGYRSDIFTSSNRPGDLLDRSNNDLYAIAERTYLVGFDPCGIVSATITQEGQG